MRLKATNHTTLLVKAIGKPIAQSFLGLIYARNRMHGSIGLAGMRLDATGERDGEGNATTFDFGGGFAFIDVSDLLDDA